MSAGLFRPQNSTGSAMPLIHPLPDEALRYRHNDRQLERLYPGLPLLLDAYAVVDMGVNEAVLADGRATVCRAGCFQCCCQPIPVSPLEALALHWHMRHRMKPEMRRLLGHRLASCRGRSEDVLLPCPFLWDGACQVYALRPVACRQYMVFNRPCAPGEDAARDRQQDVLAPRHDRMLEALARTLPWYAGREPQPPSQPAREEVQKFFRSVTTVIQAIPWERFTQA